MPRSRHNIRLFLLLILLLSLLSGLLPGLARAQGAYTATLYPLVTEKFPAITGLFDAYDPQGVFISNLKKEDVKIFEDGQPLTLGALEQTEQGAQLVIAFNPGPPLAFRDATGISRFDDVSVALINWISSQPASSTDQLSLVTPLGALATDQSPVAWFNSFSGFKPDNRNATPTLQTLLNALNTLAENPPAPGVKRAVLFITPHIDTPSAAALEDLANRAVALNARVFVWYTDSDSYFTHSSALGLQEIARKSNGVFFAYNGQTTPLPDPESYFANLRPLYRFSFASKINAAGAHTYSVRIEAGTLQLSSPDQSLDLNIQPPNAALLSPPQQIMREAPEGEYDLALLAPTEQQLKIIIEFPDGFPRAVLRTTLFVDGVPAAENLTAPFDQFTWNLRDLTKSGQHQLSVEIEDSLGLKRASLSVPVIVTVVQPPTGLRAFLGRNSWVMTMGAVILAGAVLVTIIVLGVRLRIPALADRQKKRKQYQDPVTQPVHPRAEQTPNPFAWARRARPVAAPAYLERVDADGWPATGIPIPIAANEVTFGTDPTQALQVIDDPALSPLHARLRHDEKGNFLLSDQNSVAGTWVNYEQITNEGRKLQHGDIIHFGVRAYRFMLRKPPTLPEPIVEPEQ